MRDVTSTQQKCFCRAYLRTLDPMRAAETAGIKDGHALLHDREITARLERMRNDWSAQILRDDAVRRLAELAFGRTNDAALLALARGTELPDVAGMDLSAVSELKVTEKGVEVKFIDRVRALEALCSLLGGDTGGAAEFFQALEDAGEEAVTA